MEIKLDGHARRTERSKKRWLGWYKKYQQGMTTEEIAAEEINPSTGKHYTKIAVYYGINRLKVL